MTEREVARLIETRKKIRHRDDAIAKATRVQIDFWLAVAREDAKREHRTRKGW